MAPGVTASKTPQADRIAVLAIAYHNIGVEQEFLKRYEHSILSYRKGVEVAERYLGSKHPICNTLKSSMVAAKKALAALTEKNLKGKTSVLPAIKSKSSAAPGKKKLLHAEDKDSDKLQSLREEVLAEQMGHTSLEDAEVWNQGSDKELEMTAPPPEERQPSVTSGGEEDEGIAEDEDA